MKTSIVDYAVASAMNPHELEKTVKKYLNEGWQPQGGLTVLIDEKHVKLYYQAVVRYKQES